jgi:competence protein ComEA
VLLSGGSVGAARRLRRASLTPRLAHAAPGLAGSRAVPTLEVIVHPTRRQLIAYAVLAAIVVAVGVRYLASARRAGQTAVELSAVVASPSPSPAVGTTAAASAAPLLVYACGAVANPGVYQLPAGARVADVMALAGPVAKADLASINLAARVTDGQQIVVPLKGVVAQAAAGGAAAAGSAVSGSAAASGAAGTTTASGSAPAPVSLNAATLEQLDALQGVGPVTAQKIIDYRTTNGGFKSVEELKNVPGIGEVRFAALKEYLTL